MLKEKNFLAAMKIKTVFNFYFFLENEKAKGAK